MADLSSTDYLQTYIVLKPKDPQRPDAMRDVMFRFGSWCYSGRVQVLHITQHTQCKNHRGLDADVHRSMQCTSTRHNNRGRDT